MKLEDKNLYYIGGVVRDEILGIPSFDTDYCYEGNAIEFAKNNGLEIIRENPDFGTVKVLFNKKEIDIASTRKEIYPHAGKLPEVIEIGCSLEEDLRRRDFTINTLAKRTTNNEIIDIFGGIEDIKNKKLRILHNKSFIDDPTRILRGLKFAVRFGFELDELSLNMQEQYLSNINYDISYHRLKKELIETFNLNRQEAFDKFVNQGIYKLLSKSSSIPIRIPVFGSNLKDLPQEHIWLAYMAGFDLSNLELTRSERKILDWVQRLHSEKPTNNTPMESIIINNIWGEI